MFFMFETFKEKHKCKQFFSMVMMLLQDLFGSVCVSVVFDTISIFDIYSLHSYGMIKEYRVFALPPMYRQNTKLKRREKLLYFGKTRAIIRLGYNIKEANVDIAEVRIE